MTETWKGAAFLDRDGVINEEVNYLHEPEKTVLVSGVAEALNLIHQHGYLAVVVTNQSGIARGMYGEPEMHSVHAKIRELLAPSGADFDAIYFCPHPPAAECCCRKPKPGMLLKAAEDLGIDPSISFMVGDRAGDIEAGNSAGCKATYLVRSGYGVETLKKGTPDGAIVVDNLLAAVKDFFKD